MGESDEWILTAMREGRLLVVGVGDEASSLEDAVHMQFQGWAKRQYHFGSPNDCANFWRRTTAGQMTRGNGGSLTDAGLVT